MSKGWVKFHRSMMDNDFWLAEPFTKAQAWVDIFANANHSPATFWVRDIEVKVDRGQLAWSELTMAKRWQWSRGKVRRYLGMLKARGMIVQQTDNVTSVITVCNYRAFQDGSTAGDTPNGTADSTPDGTPNEHQTVHKQEEQELENEKNVKKSMSPQADDLDRAFEKFWCAGMRKVGGKPKAKAAFKKLSGNDPIAFAEKLEADIQARIKANQFGFDRIHPLSYLNQHRWEDEIVQETNGRAASGPSQGIDFSGME